MIAQVCFYVFLLAKSRWCHVGTSWALRFGKCESIFQISFWLIARKCNLGPRRKAPGYFASHSGGETLMNTSRGCRGDAVGITWSDAKQPPLRDTAADHRRRSHMLCQWSQTAQCWFECCNWVPPPSTLHHHHPRPPRGWTVITEDRCLWPLRGYGMMCGLTRGKSNADKIHQEIFCCSVFFFLKLNQKEKKNLELSTWCRAGDKILIIPFGCLKQTADWCHSVSCRLRSHMIWLSIIVLMSSCQAANDGAGRVIKIWINYLLSA